MTAFLARRERFDRVASTNDVVRAWLAEGIEEVCLAVADEQTAGRGRAGRSWIAPSGAALLLSLGFRPIWLEPARAWRLAAVTALAMAEAAETVSGLPDGAIRLKWPNDLVLEQAGSDSERVVRKLAGLLGETDGLGSPDPRVVVGLGINADWPAERFPPELAGAMTSLREASHGRPVDSARLLDAFLGRIENGVGALGAGDFDGDSWRERQLTTGRMVRLETPEGSETVRAIGVDTLTGALIVEDEAVPGAERRVVVGEIRHVRLAAPVGARV
ncbi:MAG: BirA family transcriptional regulator [Chloroflexota bacterium]|jgi:BirA family biotin operon repressor/biotin-[acetyl-CoA-carboxylase] ligase|nr:BirA family transcriptional regulator [Chloroflexota bacterium]